MRIDAPIFTGSFSLNGSTLQNLSAVSTTGSNTFVGNQNVQGYISASALTGSIDFTNLTNSPTLVSGSSQVVNILSSLNTVTASFTPRITNLESKSASVDISITNINSVTASNIARLTNLESTSASVDISITNINSVTASNIARLNNLETKSASVDVSITNINSFTASNNITSLNSKTGSYATTGSNTFFGTQTYSGSVYIANDLVVQGSSSIQYISASSVSIGTNIVQLNTANPSVRFAGLTMIDSGSIGGSGSFLYDSLQDEFIFVHRGNGTNVTSSHFVLGPETYDSLGNETYLTSNIIPKGTGKEHLVDSCIFDNGTTTCIKNNLIGTGTITGTTIYGSTAVCSPVGKFTTCLDLGGALTGTSAVFSSSVQGDFLVVGTTAASSGGLRLGTQVAIRARNVGNTANIPLIESTASDGVSVSNGALILASTGAASFSSTLSLNSASDTSGGFLLLKYMANANSRTWKVSNDQSNYGDFVIQVSTTQTGSTFISPLQILNTGAAIFSSTITGTTIYGSTAVCSPVGKFTSCIDAGSGNFSSTINAATGITIGTSGTNDISWGTAGGIKLSRTNVGAEYALSQRWTGTLAYIDIGSSCQWNGGVTILPNGGGCVGIGTCSPTNILTIKNNSGGTNGIDFQNYSTSGVLGQITYSQADDTFNIVNTSAYAAGGIVLKTNSTDRMRITSAGNVGIGTCSPQRPLHVKGVFEVEDGTSSNYSLIYQSNAALAIETLNATAMTLNTNGNERMRITSTGIACFACTVCAPRLNLNRCNAAPVLNVNNEDSTDDAGVRGLAISTDRLRFGVSPATSTYGTIATNGTNSGITFVTYDTAWTEKMRIACNGDLTIKGSTHCIYTNSSATISFDINSTRGRFYQALTVDGTVTKGGGSFKIDHPLESKKDTYNLYHSFVESPKADLIYRGKVTLTDGYATVNIDTAADMSEGTFEVLVKDVQCFTTNENGWNFVKGTISGNILTIESDNTNCNDEISWMVIGERNDKWFRESTMVDENGKTIVEKLKSETT